MVDNCGNYINSEDTGLEFLLNMNPCYLDFDALFGVEAIMTSDGKNDIQDMEIDEMNNENGNVNNEVISLTKSCTPSIDDLIREAIEGYCDDVNKCVHTGALSGLDCADRPSDSDIKAKMEFIVSKKEAIAVWDLFEVLKYDSDFTPSALYEIEEQWKKSAAELQNEQAKHLQTIKALEQAQFLLKKLEEEMKRSTCSSCFKLKRSNLVESQGDAINNSTLCMETSDDVVIGKLLFEEGMEDVGATTDSIEAASASEDSLVNVGKGGEEEILSGLDPDSWSAIIQFMQENSLSFEDIVSEKKFSKLTKTIIKFKGKSPSNFTSVVSKVLVNFLNGNIMEDGVPDLSFGLRDMVLKLLSSGVLDRISKLVRDSEAPKNEIHPFALEIRERFLLLKREKDKALKILKKLRDGK